MKNMEFTIEINAARAKVWDTLWRDETFRSWAGIIDPGTYIDGELKQGNEVQFISGNGYGVTSLVEKLVPGESLILRHRADTQGSGQQDREKQWTGGIESYRLEEQGGGTLLKVAFDVPPELEQYFRDTYPKAMQMIKSLAERR